MLDMKRRDFITLLGGAAAAWPLAARAQQGERMRRIGVLTNLAENDPEGQVRHAAFLKGLQELGWLEGRNLRVESRWTAGTDPVRLGVVTSLNRPGGNVTGVTTLNVEVAPKRL